jgi:hypothetical protein
MKTTKWVGLLSVIVFPFLSGTAQPPPPENPGGPTEPQGSAPAPTDLSPAAAEVIKLAGSGVGDDVILAYIQNSQAPFNLSANQLLYLRDLGLSSQTITAMISRDASLHTQPQPNQPAPPPPVPEPAPQQQAPPPDYVNTPPPAEVNYFYGDLAPYGSWVVLPGYGWCWQPRAVVINHGWRPYCDSGHWIYSDCGWYWHSDYSWGWAPFHYGRWFLDNRCGWVWTPDTVWAPAWVTWRVAGDNCGWAPLPPHAYFDVRSGWRYNGVSVSVGFDFGLHADHFTFVSINNFNQHDIRHHELPQAQVTKVYNQTTIVNNYTVNKNTIVNRGIAVDRVAAATHTEIRTAKVQDLPVSSGHSFATRSFEKPGSVVYRPQLKTPPKATTAVVAQKVDERHPVIQHSTITPVSTSSATTIQSRSLGSQTAPRNPFAAPARPSSSVATPSPAPRSTSQPETPKGAPPTVQKTPAAPVPSRAPQTPPPVYSVPKSAPATPSSSAAPAHPFGVPKQSARVSSPPSSDVETHASPSPSPSPGRGRDDSPISAYSATESKPTPAPSQTQTPHVYYPKSYYQAHDSGSSGQRQSSSGWPGSSGSSSSQSKKSDSKKGD